MAKHRWIKMGWSRTIVALVVMLSVVAVSLAEDGAKGKKAGQGKNAKLPEVVRTEEHEDVDGYTKKSVASKGPKSPPTLKSSQIDELILKGLATNNAPVSEVTNDEEFIRRVYLDVIGRLPNPGNIREFVTSRVRNKRALLIDSLLTNSEFAENWARYWRDVVSYRSPNENDRQVNYPLFEKWLTGQFSSNKPWNEIATAIITATGRNDENGATAFAVAEEGSPVEMAGEVSRVFLGVQIQCAQCHDHPSDPWKRQQFHEFAAFFTGVKSKRAEKAEKGKQQAFVVTTDGPPHYSMPDLKNPEKKIYVAPRFFLKESPHVSEQVKAAERLKLVAGYITDSENPWFARAFVNRVWYSLMGEGFYNPVDDLGPTRTPNSPELLDLIAEQWVQSGYDIRWLFRMVLNTDAYQRASRSTNTAAGRTPFASNVPSRLRADQIFDALTHALDLQHERDAVGTKPTPGKMGEMAATKGPLGRDNFIKTFGVDPSTPNDEVIGTIPQALFLMNSTLVTREIQARPKSMLGYLLMNHPDNRSVLDILYMRALGRRPTDKEVRSCSNFLHTIGDRSEAFEDILWALLNSTEFLSRR
jgi:Protein of unknown function (DUF1549)/Protein of unknown function (DUF1553)